MKPRVGDIIEYLDRKFDDKYFVIVAVEPNIFQVKGLKTGDIKHTYYGDKDHSSNRHYRVMCKRKFIKLSKLTNYKSKVLL